MKYFSHEPQRLMREQSFLARRCKTCARLVLNSWRAHFAQTKSQSGLVFRLLGHCNSSQNFSSEMNRCDCSRLKRKGVISRKWWVWWRILHGIVLAWPSGKPALTLWPSSWPLQAWKSSLKAQQTMSLSRCHTHWLQHPLKHPHKVWQYECIGQQWACRVPGPWSHSPAVTFDYSSSNHFGSKQLQHNLNPKLPLLSHMLQAQCTAVSWESHKLRPITNNSCACMCSPFRIEA